MSFGRSSSRSSSFGKQKKEKRKKQEFHKHKVKFTEEEKLDFTALRDKTVVSLVHLGKQQFSQEAGGYGFENWMKSFNLLIDNFEEEAGSPNLPKDYFEKRQEFTSTLLKPLGPELDSEISKLQEKEREILEKLQRMGARLTHDQDSEKRTSKIDALNVERATYIDHLEDERRRLAQRRKEIEDSKGFLKRVFYGSKEKGPTISSIEATIDELESKVKGLDGRISQLRRRHDQSSYGVFTEKELKQEFPRQYSDIEEVRSQLEEFQSKKLNETGNSQLREQVTEAMSKIISKIELPSEESKAVM
ncbi:MAG: hypothetical protein ACRECH_04675 [Nitrososphaerales archaeon]